MHTYTDQYYTKWTNAFNIGFVFTEFTLEMTSIKTIKTINGYNISFTPNYPMRLTFSV